MYFIAREIASTAKKEITSPLIEAGICVNCMLQLLSFFVSFYGVFSHISHCLSAIRQALSLFSSISVIQMPRKSTRLYAPMLFKNLCLFASHLLLFGWFFILPLFLQINPKINNQLPVFSNYVANLNTLFVLQWWCDDERELIRWKIQDVYNCVWTMTSCKLHVHLKCSFSGGHICIGDDFQNA